MSKIQAILYFYIPDYDNLMKATRISNIISLLLFTAYTIYVILSGEANLFFIIYLFFLDEVIKNVFILIKSIRYNLLGYDVSEIKIALKSRFFMLFIYSVFIILIFGIFFSLMNATMEQFTRNMMILFFKDVYFNISITIIILREGTNLFIDLKRAKKEDNFKITGIDSGMIVLHLSIILGGFMWFLTSGKFEYFQLSFGKYNSMAIIFPFLVIKFLFDLYTIIGHQKASIKAIN